VPLNSDDRTVVEFAFARSVNLIDGFQLANLRASAHLTRTNRPKEVEGEVDWARVDEARLPLYAALSHAETMQTIMSTDQRARAAAFFSYLAGDLNNALSYWRAQTQEPQTLPELMMLAECLAAQANNNALPYIDKLGESLPLDAEAIRAEFFWADRRGTEATESFGRFFQGLRGNPWPGHDLIKRSLARARTIGGADPSKEASRFLYQEMRIPFCAFNNESDRLAALLATGIYIDGSTPGDYTLHALEAFEPYVLWERKFLQIRDACYGATKNARAEQARRDLNEFMRHEPLLGDLSALTKDIESRTTPATDGDNSNNRAIPETVSPP
jgi:hypothetical protein